MLHSFAPMAEAAGTPKNGLTSLQLMRCVQESNAAARLARRLLWVYLNETPVGPLPPARPTYPTALPPGSSLKASSFPRLLASSLFIGPAHPARSSATPVRPL